MESDKEKKAMSLFAKTFDCTFLKLDERDVDYKLFKDSNLISYVEIGIRNRIIREAYPLSISLRKIVKLSDKRITGVVIWACDDGIIYGKIDKLYGTVRMGGVADKPTPYNDSELMAYYDKQDSLRYIKYS